MALLQEILIFAPQFIDKVLKIRKKILLGFCDASSVFFQEIVYFFVVYLGIRNKNSIDSMTIMNILDYRFVLNTIGQIFIGRVDFLPGFFQVIYHFLLAIFHSYKKNRCVKYECKSVGGHSMITWIQFCPFLTTIYLNMDIFNPERGQKQRFLDHLPPLCVHVVIECPLTFIPNYLQIIREDFAILMSHCRIPATDGSEF